jgi:activator of 2-hydroxyglutaryl-CoA dehydratase
LGGRMHTIKKNTEALLVASKEIGLDVKSEKTKCVVMSRNQNAGQNHNIKIDNKSFERVEKFKYLGKILTNQNYIQEERADLSQEMFAIIWCRAFCLPVCCPEI